MQNASLPPEVANSPYIPRLRGRYLFVTTESTLLGSAPNNHPLHALSVKNS